MLQPTFGVRKDGFGAQPALRPFFRPIGKRAGVARFLLLAEIRAHVGAAVAAGLARNSRFQIGEPNVIRPLVGADRCRMTVPIVRAIDQQAANAGGAHFAHGVSKAARALALSLDDQPVAVMLNLVDPVLTRGDLGCPGRDAGLERQFTHVV